MGLTNTNKLISMDRIDCSGSLKVTLALAASPDISTSPTDIVLVLSLIHIFRLLEQEIYASHLYQTVKQQRFGGEFKNEYRQPVVIL